MKQKTIVRALEDADPAFASAKELLSKLKASLSAIDREEDDLRFRLSNRKPGAEKTSRVAALLGEEVDDDNSAPDGVSERLKQLAGERVDLRAAIEIATQRLATARHSASKIICAEVREEYTVRVKAVTDTLIAAHQAHADLLELAEQLNDRNIAWTGSLPPMHATAIFGHDSGRISGWLKDAANAGFIEQKSIPSELAR
jgi:chromosome segregation ATPase